MVTLDRAALWTDSRYFLQAEVEIDENWTLMKDGLPVTPSQADWLAKVLPVGVKVGVDPFLMATDVWKTLSKQLKSNGQYLVPVSQNLVDLVWDEQPDPPLNSVIVLPNEYTGKTWQKKVKDVRAKMKDKKADALVLTALDEVAWFLNLRGSDIEYNPVFFAYVVIKHDSVELFVDEKKFDKSIEEHLQLNGSKSEDGTAVTLKPYGDIQAYVSELAIKVSKIWISNKSSFALASCTQKSARIGDPSPVCAMKAVKNPVEIGGMKRAHIKDAVTLCEFFSWMEKEVPKGHVTELSAADKLESIKKGQEDYVCLSFATISSTGSHGAVIHYRPLPETDRTVVESEVYLCDSGAQYKDGTTDVTRTMHFSTPTSHQQDCFTRVLKGHINLATAIFPNGVKGHMLDTLARTALWESGLDYLHGTGHGVGAFLNVHEGPCGISSRVNPADVPLEEGMILSNEPGYYEDGQFGVRIENLYIVTKIETEHNFRKKGFLTFEPLTLVPIQRKMLNPKLLTQKEQDWLNNYHEICRDVVGEELQLQGKTEAYAWLMKETTPLG